MIFLPVDCELFKVKNYTLHPQKVHHINTTPFCQEPFCINMMPVLGFSCCIESVLVRSMLSENASEPLFWTLLLHVWDLGGSWAAISRFGKEKAGASTAILCQGYHQYFIATHSPAEHGQSLCILLEGMLQAAATWSWEVAGEMKSCCPPGYTEPHMSSKSLLLINLLIVT